MQTSYHSHDYVLIRLITVAAFFLNRLLTSPYALRDARGMSYRMLFQLIHSRAMIGPGKGGGRQVMIGKRPSRFLEDLRFLEERG